MMRDLFQAKSAIINLLVVAGSISAGFCQPKARPDSLRTITLSNVEVTASAKQLTVVSGTAKDNSWQIVSPGGQHAIRFFAPRPEFHSLRSLTFYLRNPRTIQEGNLRVRIASPTESGEPAENDLLPTPLILTTDQLRSADKALTLEWTATALIVPPDGFFIVLEYVGNYPDEFLADVIIRTKRSIPQYVIRRRSRPDTEFRLVNSEHFPIIKNIIGDRNSAESWYRDTVTRQWRRERDGGTVLLVKAIFK